MAQITKLFTKGLDTDTAPHLQEKESYSSAMNVHFSLGSLLGVSDGQSGNMSGYNIGGNLGVLEPFAGNTDWTTLFSTLGVTGYNQNGAKCIGYAVDDTESISNDTRFFYLFIYTPAFSATLENSWIIKVAIKYNGTTKVNTISIADSSILLDSNWITPSVANALGFEADYFVSARTSGNQLIWTDGHNAVRYVDVNKDYNTNNPTLEELSLITEPGVVPLTANRGSDSTKAASLQFRAVQFMYRIINEDGFVSVLSPFSLTSLPSRQEEVEVDPFFGNVVTISLSKDQKIPDNWKKVDFVMRYLDTNTFDVIRTFDKYDTTSREYNFGMGPVYYTDAQLVYEHNTGPFLVPYITVQNYDGSIIVETLDPAYCAKAFDSVPITSQSLEFSSNRLFLANNLEGYDTPATAIDITLTQNTATTEFSKKMYSLTPYLLAIRENGTGFWYGAVVTRNYGNGKNYAFPLSSQDIVFDALQGGGSYSPSGLKTTEYTYITLPQTISEDNLIELSESRDFNPLIVNQAAFAPYDARIEIIKEVNKYWGEKIPYSGVTNDICVPFNRGTTYSYPACMVFSPSEYNDNNLNSRKAAFLPSSTYSYGVTFYDEALRKSGNKYIGDITIGSYNADTKTLVESIGVNVTGVQPAGSVPSWAKYYSINLTNNNKASSFLQFVPDVIRYAYKSADGIIVYNVDEADPDGDYYGVAIPLNSLYQRSQGYAYNEGDLCQFEIYNYETSTYSGSYTLPVLTSIDGYVIVNSPKSNFNNYISYQGKKLQYTNTATGLNSFINDFLNDPSLVTNPKVGDVFLIDSAPVGAWAGHPNTFAVYSTGGVWNFTSYNVPYVNVYNFGEYTNTPGYLQRSGGPGSSWAATGLISGYLAYAPSLLNQQVFICTLYTPKTVQRSFYEVAFFGEVSGGSLLAPYNGLLAKLYGDTYIQGSNSDGGAFNVVSETNNESRYKYWIENSGRITPSDTIGQKGLTNQIRWSNVKIPNSSVNGLASFDALDVSDVDSNAGPITSIILSSKEANLASRLVILCNSGSFIGLIGQAQIYSQDQSTAFLSSAPVLGTIQPITGQWGCISPQGVISYKGMVFWADALNREIIQLAGDGATPISQQKAGFLWNQVFRNLPFDESAISAKNIKIGINPYTSEIFITCPVPNITPTQFPANCGENRLNQYIGDKKVSYVYNYQLNRWVGAYEDNPDQWIRVGDDVFTVGSQYLNNGLNLYKEFDSTPGDFNQSANPSCYISFPISEGYPATIEPLSVILMGQLTTTKTVVYARDSSTSVNNNLTQVTCWNDSNYATREGEKFAPVLRNRLSNNANQSQVLSISPISLGSGYLTAPSVAIGPPDVAGGTQAVAVSIINTAGEVIGYTITNPGTGYTLTPAISIGVPPSGGTQATASISVGVAANNTYDYQGIKGDRIRSKTPWVQVTFPAEQQINFQGARFEVKPSSGH
jgi:hypothetical protein